MRLHAISMTASQTRAVETATLGNLGWCRGMGHHGVTDYYHNQSVHVTVGQSQGDPEQLPSDNKVLSGFSGSQLQKSSPIKGHVFFL